MLELTVNLDERSYPIYIGQSALQETGRLREHIVPRTGSQNSGAA